MQAGMPKTLHDFLWHLSAPNPDGRGVVSGLQLKGVTNESAGNFANHVDEHGTIWIHDHKHGQGPHKTIPIHAAK
jgi:hypothetical protein